MNVSSDKLWSDIQEFSELKYRVWNFIVLLDYLKEVVDFSSSLEG